MPQEEVRWPPKKHGEIIEIEPKNPGPPVIPPPPVKSDQQEEVSCGPGEIEIVSEEVIES